MNLLISEQYKFIIEVLTVSLQRGGLNSAVIVVLWVFLGRLLSVCKSEWPLCDRDKRKCKVFIFVSFLFGLSLFSLSPVQSVLT